MYQEMSSQDKDDAVYSSFSEEWLATAFSEHCILCVLHNKIPELNKLLEDSMMDLSISFNILANNARKQEKNVKNIAEAAISLKIGDNKTSIQEEVQEIRKLVEGEAAKQRLDALSASIDEQRKVLEGVVSVALESSDQMMIAVSSAIVGMQFQDRISQNLVITENVLGMLSSRIGGGIENQKAKRSDGVPIDADYANKLSELLLLGELRHKFLKKLIDSGYVEDSSILNTQPIHGECKQDSDDNIELF